MTIVCDSAPCSPVTHNQLLIIVNIIVGYIHSILKLSLWLSAAVLLMLTEIGSTISNLFGGGRKTDETAETKESSEDQKDEVDSISLSD